jgi:pSer/pThr/pTyr-binding forkhead associated (FHA) protein
MSFKLIKVGRAADNDIVLNHSSVSRYHCEFFYDTDGNVFLTDKGSANGTFVNGRRISGSVQLQSNDIVKPGLDNPLRWKSFGTHQNISAGTQTYSSNPVEESPQVQNSYLYTPKKNNTMRTVLVTLGVIAGVLLVWFLLSEFIIGEGKPEEIDPDKPNDKRDQPNKKGEDKEIIYDFSCLNDDNDYGTTEVIDVLETIDSEVTDVFGGEISIQEEEEIGNQLLADCRNEYRFVESGVKIENLRTILTRLTDQITSPKGFHYQIFLIESDDLNAFTAGAKIFVTTTMYEFCETSDELACVIGHEINHNELGHIKEHLQKERILTEGGAALASMLTVSFGQKKETHCDMTGIDLAIAAGYNGCVNIQLWKRMQEKFDEGEYDVRDNLLRSHPYSEKRATCSHHHIESNYNFDCTEND